MITDGFSYLAFLVFFAGVIVVLERYYEGKFFKYVPAIVVLYFSCMLLSTLGLWEKGPSINATYKGVKSAILPAMIFLMLLRCDLRKIVRLGPRMLLGFVAASLSIAVGFIVTFACLRTYYEPTTWKAFAALCGSWMGGTGNMVAIQGALHVPDAKLGYALLMDSINYAVWVMLLLAVVPFAQTFNRWARADTSAIDEVGKELAASQEKARQTIEFSDLLILVGTGLFVSAVARCAAGGLPQTTFLTATTWTVLIATVVGVACAVTRLGTLPGSNHLANIMLYTLVALIASRANFAELGKAPLYIASGFLILAIHALLMLLAAKLFKLDLFTCGVASLANIGGVASAPILAAAYSDVLVPIGVLMAMLGYVVGTGGGLVVGKILSLLM